VAGGLEVLPWPKVDFEKFGATATVTPPPAAQTGDLTDAIKARQQQQG